MKLPCTLYAQSDGLWRASYVGRDLEAFAVTAASREAALEKMRGELRYRLELCPCTGASYEHVPIELVEPGQG